jgi:hypothetical protein
MQLLSPDKHCALLRLFTRAVLIPEPFSRITMIFHLHIFSPVLRKLEWEILVLHLLLFLLFSYLSNTKVHFYKSMVIITDLKYHFSYQQRRLLSDKTRLTNSMDRDNSHVQLNSGERMRESTWRKCFDNPSNGLELQRIEQNAFRFLMGRG